MGRLVTSLLTITLLVISYRALYQALPFYNPPLFTGLAAAIAGSSLLVVIQLRRNWANLRERGIVVLFQRAIAAGIDFAIVVVFGVFALFVCAGGYALFSSDHQMHLPLVVTVAILVAVSFLRLIRDVPGTFFSMGKRLMQLRVVSTEDLRPYGIRESITRNILLYVYMVTAFLSSDPERTGPGLFKSFSLVILLLIVADAIRAYRTPDLQMWLEQISKTKTVRVGNRKPYRVRKENRGRPK